MKQGPGHAAQSRAQHTHPSVLCGPSDKFPHMMLIDASALLQNLKAPSWHFLYVVKSLKLSTSIPLNKTCPLS